MCGICGFLDYKGKLDEEALRAMRSRLVHRGPDAEGSYLFRQNGLSAGLGHRRLKIIDLSDAASQPMSNEDGTIRVVFNGEIYNYKALREVLEKKGHRFKSATDTETLLHLYEERGFDCLQHIRGMFAFAIWDERQRLLFLARDRLGKKPLLYSYREGRFCFASEFSALLASGLISKEVNADAVASYLAFGYIPSPVSIYKEIFKLPPAHYLVLKEKECVLTRYWQLDYAKKLLISEEDAAAETLRLLREAVKIRLYSDVPLGAFLSGGIDSSIVVALMAQEAGERVNTFSIGFDEGGYNELSFARNIARRYDTKHREFIVKPDALSILPSLIEHFGEPYADSSCLPTYYVSKLTREHVTVALNGDGGDEAFAGYERYAAMQFAERFNGIPVPLRRALARAAGFMPSKQEPKDPAQRLKRFLRGLEFTGLERYFFWAGIMGRAQRAGLLSDAFKKRCVLDPEGALAVFLGDPGPLGLTDTLLRADTLTYLPEDLLVKVDITSMSNSLEARSPLLDHTLFEFAASLPPQYKLKMGVKKYILKKAAKELLPPENIHRKKMGFGVPVTRWFRAELKDHVRDTLLSPAALKRDYFKPEAVKDMIDSHINGRRDYGSQLWALLMLEMWHRRFID